MLLKIQVGLFRNALNKILSVVDKKNSRHILTYTQVTAKDNVLELSATDLEVSAKITINAIVEKPGTICVNAKNIFDILRELPEGEISFNVDLTENLLKINCGDIFYSILVYKNDDFPHLIFENKGNEFTLTAKQTLEIINKTSYAISNDETRIFLNGIFLQEVDTKLRAVATDGYRLSLIETELNSFHNENLINGIIIPRKGVYELKKLAENYPDSALKLSVDDSFIYINAENKYYLSIRLIAREYPKYQEIIPSKTTYRMIADKTTIFDAVRRIKIMSNEKSNGVRLNINGCELKFTANHPSLGDAQEKLNVEYDGKSMEIGFNAKFLIETLSSFDEGDISIELNNELSPILIKSASLPNYLGIIMPLKF